MRPFTVRFLLIGTILLLGVNCSVNAALDDDYFNYLKSVFEQQDRKLADYLIEELNSYIRLFPQSVHVAEVRFLKARVVADSRDEHRAFILFMKTLYLNPNSVVHNKCAEGARVIVTTNKQYRDHKNELTLLINGEFAPGKPADLLYQYLTFLHDLGMDKLRRWSLVEYQEFVDLYPDDVRAEKIQYWIAEAYMLLGDYREAAASFMKFEHLYPDSHLVPSVRIRRADILDEKLKNPELAVQALTAVIEDFPQTGNAGTALFNRADIKASRFKDINGAIADYQLLVHEMPQHNKAVDALFELAEIYIKKQKNYRQALDTYNQIVADYPENRKCISALEESAKIYLDKQKQPVSAADSYGKVADLFPDDPKSPEMLLKAGEICQNKAKIIDQALVYYERLVAQYPQSDQAGKAREKIAKILGQPEN